MHKTFYDYLFGFAKLQRCMIIMSNNFIIKAMAISMMHFLYARFCDVSGREIHEK